MPDLQGNHMHEKTAVAPDILVLLFYVPFSYIPFMCTNWCGRIDLRWGLVGGCGIIFSADLVS